MFASIFAFELRRWMRSVSTYIYFGILFILTFLLATAAGGTWDSVNVSLGIGEKVHANSPFEIDFLITFITSYIGVIFVIAIIGNSVLKDFASNTYSMIFTTSVSKFNYLFGRFTASLVVCLFICLASVFATMLAFVMPWINADKLGPFMPAAYWNTFVLTIIPNILLMGTIFFAVSLFSRDLFIIWLSLIGFYVLLGVSSSYTNNLKHETLAALIDPMTPNLKFIYFKYWTIADKNNKMIPLEGIFLLNRIIWISFSLLLLGISYWYFSFSISPRVTIFKRRKLKDNEADLKELAAGRIGLMSSSQVFTNSNYLKNLVGLIKNEVRTILRNTYFRIILVFGLGFLLLVSSEIGKLYDTSTYPVTYAVIGYFGGVFRLFIVVLTIMFSGELVWRNRDYRTNLIMDALPVPAWVFYLSKVISLMIIQALLLCVVIVAGVIVQTFKGYTNYEILLYVRYLFGFSIINLWLLAILAVLIQTLVNNKYIGYFITALFYIWNTIFATIVFKHNFFSYGSDPGFVYSDMNGFGHGVAAYYTYKIFWGALAVCLAVISSLLWARGTETRFKFRLAEARRRATRSTWVLIIASFCIFLVSGGFIYYNTNIENKFTSDYQQEQKQLAYERKYKKYAHISQPKVTAVKLNADIYPMERRLHSTGTYVLKNKTNKVIDSIHIFLPDAVKPENMSFDRPSKLAMQDDDYNYRIYSLSKPLQPGDSTTLSFDLEIISKGFKESFESTLNAPVYNGTFMNNRQFLPTIGYSEGYEISDNNTRKKYKLPYKRPNLPINDSTGHYTNLFTKDADFITFEVTVSTIPGQIALAPGYLQKEWTENGRHYFHYKMDSRIANFFSILSADWQVKKEMYNGVSLEIYYQKGHEYNLDRMFNGMKKSLAYYTKSFGPYQHRQLRILEFPRYASFAQSFDNTVPYSEAIGFIAMVRSNNDGDIDYPFYITAHETAHQWWGHQIIGANVEGSNMMSESLAQYSSITLLEKEYGMEKVDKFLAYEMNNYLQSRSFEKEKEKPLQYVDDGQAYILYQKGGLVFHSLQKYIGEDSLNHAMRRFITRYKFQGPPYPSTLDFVSSIRQSTPDSMKYLLTDMFEKIILYDNKLNSVSYSNTGKDNYKVNAVVESTKYEDDSLGAEKAIASNDYVEVGLYDKNDKCLKLQKFKMHKGTNNISMQLNKEPYKVIVDPEHLLIDKKLDDNEKTLDKPAKTLASK